MIRYNPDDSQWYSQMWTLWVRKVSDVNNGHEEEWFYEIYSDRPLYGNSTIEEEAIDPLTQETLGNGSFDNTVNDNKTINLTQKPVMYQFPINHRRNVKFFHFLANSFHLLLTLIDKSPIIPVHKR
jgi:hypothetical protein